MRESQKFSPALRRRSHSKIMANLGNFFSAAQISALKSVATAQTDAEILAPSLLDHQRDGLYEFAAEYNVKLTKAFWQELETLNKTKENIIVRVQGKNAVIEHMDRCEIFARHVGMLLKRGEAMFFVGVAMQINWDNWKSIYAKLAPAKSTKTTDYDQELSRNEYRALVTAHRKEKEFYDLARPIRAKKGGRMRISFEDARAQRVRAEKESFNSKVVLRANRILANL